MANHDMTRVAVFFGGIKRTRGGKAAEMTAETWKWLHGEAENIPPVHRMLISVGGSLRHHVNLRTDFRAILRRVGDGRLRVTDQHQRQR